MKRHTAIISRLLAAALAGVCAAGPALADPPPWAGGGKHGNKHEERYEDRYDERRDDRRHDRRDDDRRGSISFRFGDGDRRQVHDYYGAEFRSGNCPPGLAKKHNGCLPPGQAKKWSRGRPLPGDLRYYDLPRDLLVHLPPPPRDHKYVRVASDILLIAIGTSMVLDAIEDIGR